LLSSVKPLDPLTDFSYEHWISNSNYNPAKRVKYEMARDLVAQNERELESFCHVKSFLKDEFYEEFKYARTINARVDWFKVTCGPIFHAIEKQIFKRNEFVKYLPMKHRGQHLRDVLSNYKYYAETDFKSFESCFTEQIMEACEFQLYDHMLLNCPIQLQQMKFFKQVLGGKNVLKFKGFRMWLRAVRMSGEMTTSLGNGFSNLMLQKFYAHKYDLVSNGLIEGDDGAFGYMEYPPDPAGFFSRLGFTLTFGVKTNLHNVQFCGLTCSSEGSHMIDFRKPLLTHCWIKPIYKQSKYLKICSIVKGKCFSLYDRVPNCPVVSAFNKWVFNKCGDVRSSIESSATDYERYQFSQVDKKNCCEPGPISQQVRMEYWENYKISPDEQVELETLFSIDSEQMAWHPLFVKLFHPDTYEMAQHILEADKNLAYTVVRSEKEYAKFKIEYNCQEGETRVHASAQATFNVPETAKDCAAICSYAGMAATKTNG